MRALAPVVLALAFASTAQAAPVGHRVERLTVAGTATGEARDVPVHLWYPADASASARPLSTYSSALNGQALIPGKTPLSWRIDAELAREGATIEPGGAPFPVIVFSHGSV